MMQLDGLFRAIAQEQDQLLSQGQRRAAARRRLLFTSAPENPSFSTRLLKIGLAACLVSFCAGIALLWSSRAQRPMTAEFGETHVPVTAGAWLDAPEGSSAPLRFSDGTQIEVAPRARLRMLSLHPRGAHLALESGRAAVDVAHGEDRNWELRAGPFLVRVTGTRFDLAWDPNADSFDLNLNEGQVELVGCGFGSGRKLVAGQRVHASCRENTVQIAYSNQPVDSGTARAVIGGTIADAQRAEVSDLNANGTGSEVVTAPGKPKAGEDPARCDACTGGLDSAGPHGIGSTPAEDWITHARNGKYAEALRAANRLGFSNQCARLRADELALLGDTARHAGDAVKARTAYGQLRSRFAGSKHASLAAFHLGLLEFDHFANHAKAASWFRTYLDENPTGPLTREARGRLMEASHRTGSAASSGLASAYLRDYPSGPHAQLARRIVSSR